MKLLFGQKSSRDSLMLLSRWPSRATELARPDRRTVSLRTNGDQLSRLGQQRTEPTHTAVGPRLSGGLRRPSGVSRTRLPFLRYGEPCRKASSSWFFNQSWAAISGCVGSVANHIAQVPNRRVSRSQCQNSLKCK
ncbi:hypothetical protein DPMN_008943 [Dreissena polymorpha]|uniref:Uncharacterized protein n=1 Tax=Dreissena polymorpha TaxID=45954 RepID=A0A9D4S062_DREPO|nr:hypothetical protein DPMN_008943 [Dreissena polymorpha]